MSNRKVKKRSDSEREQEYEAMLKAALARPGVHEVMKVYDGWREKDRGLGAYRSATKDPHCILTTNSSNAR